MTEKKVSACVLIYDPIAQMIFAEHPTGRLWYKKGTKEPEKGVFSLPKGIIEDEEDAAQAAIREIKEETNIDLDPKRLHYCGHHKYIKYKDLEMFVYITKEDEIDIKLCKCTSFFDGPGGKKLPEVNGFVWLNRETDLDYFLYAQQIVIKEIMEKHPEYFQ
jgi:predicted NUDIX family NTP pyrophosphohydrolase